MNKFETAITTVGKDVLHVVEYPFVHTAKFVAVLSDAIKNEPPVKAAIVGLVQAAEAAIGDVSIAAVTKGVDIPEDIKAVTDIESFFVYFKNTFLPAIESAYKTLAADTK